jgi:hypothetical protein
VKVDLQEVGSVLLTEYCSGDKIERNWMGGACSTYGERRGVNKVLVGKPEGKRSLGRPRHRWADNVKMDFQDVGMWGCGLDRPGSG